MAQAASPAPKPRPNIILILADDMGSSDIGGFGSEVHTPNLDRLAVGGARLSQMYNCARCCPSRASLLTGLYPHQAGIGHMVQDRALPAYQGYLNDHCATIAEILRPAGHRTAMSGKWHVGGHYAPDNPDTWRPGEPGHPLPTQRGFDHHFGTLAGAGSSFAPPTLMRNGTPLTPDGDVYYTDAIRKYAAAIAESACAHAPFFLYVAFTAPHWRCMRESPTSARTRAATTRGGPNCARPTTRRCAAAASSTPAGPSPPRTPTPRPGETSPRTAASGKPSAWRSTPPRSPPWTATSAASCTP